MVSITFRRIHELFYPSSIAVIGAPRGMKMGKLFLVALKDQGFKGPIYAVNPQASEIDGIRCYPSISAVPSQVDLAIILVPNYTSVEVLRECAGKGVKWAILFTSGFKETGTPQGRALEKILVEIAKSAGMRIIGPNCMGIYCPSSGLSFFPELPREPGPIGLVTQSGSLGNIMGRLAHELQLRFSKVVSIGNQCDLTASELLEYMAYDPETKVIGVYLEGVRDGRDFLRALKVACQSKPVVLWKVGLTPEGAKAAVSHTGSIGGSRVLWECVARQAGAAKVDGLEPWIDALMGFAFIQEAPGPKIGIISGPGGLAVAAAESCGREGLALARFSKATRERLVKIVPPTGTSRRNPVDVGLTASFDMRIYLESARALAQDPGVDALLIISMGMSVQENRDYARSIIQLKRDCKKPFLMVNIPGFDPGMGRPFLEAKIPFFPTAERALSTYRLVLMDRKRRVGQVLTSSALAPD